MILTVFLLGLLVPMLLGMPVAFAMLVSGVALMLAMGQFDPTLMAQTVVNGADSFPLLALPFFILAGEIMNAGGISRRIVDIAMTLLGHLRGGLGYVVILTTVMLASLSGSAVADAAALSAFLVPTMIKAGYNPGRTVGLIAAGAIIAPIIPPSIPFVFFGVLAGVSITKLFLAGIVPGLLLALSLWITWWWIMRTEAPPRLPRASLAQIGRAARQGSWALGMPLIIIFGLKFGVVTPTEAAVACAVYAYLVATFVYRELRHRDLYAIFVRVAMTTSVVMLLVASAMLSSWLVTVSGIAQTLVELFGPLITSPILLMLVIMVLVVIIGTALDFGPTVLILTPILMPIVKAAGIDPVYFGVLFVVNNAIGLISPPVGTVLNVVAGVSRVGMTQVISGVWPFMFAQLAMLGAMTLFPWLVTAPAAWLAR
ncbi:MAG TPA: TRAP transporter large permease subunit [Burkholderiaceae bacterium]